MNQEKIGKFIAELRKEKGLTQSELAEAINLTDKAISKWETGKSIPDVSNLDPLSEILGVNVAELLSGERKAKNNDDESDNLITSIRFYNNKIASKFRKRINALILIILLISLVLLSIFVINNYNTCNLYSIKSENKKYDLSGSLIFTNSKNVLVIGNLVLRDSRDLENIKILDYEYSLSSSNSYITKIGNIGKYSYDNSNDLINLKDIFDKIEIYLDLKEGNNVFDNININAGFNLDILYIDENGNIGEINIPLKIEKEFSNNQLIYKNLFK